MYDNCFVSYADIIEYNLNFLFFFNKHFVHKTQHTPAFIFYDSGTKFHTLNIKFIYAYFPDIFRLLRTAKKLSKLRSLKVLCIIMNKK